MKVIVTEKYEEMSKNAAIFLLKRIAQVGRVNVGLPTGNTPTGMYDNLVQYIKLGYPVDNAYFYNIDEYCGISEKEIGTCAGYLEDNFYRRFKVNRNHVHFLNEKNHVELDRELDENGGLDTVILGIGENGHIAYNEPGTAFETHTHILSLTNESKQQHSKEFGGYDFVPNTAVTMGIKTIMNAKNIVLMANGRKKARILKDSLTGPINMSIPASILQLHPNLIVFADSKAVTKF